MNDSSRTVLDTETPVNPYSLLEAVNRSSDTVNVAWLIFIGLMSYLLITVGAVTQTDLLLNSDVTLPLLQAKIDLRRFFLCAPIVLVLVHGVVLGQLVLLAGKAMEFASAIRMLEISDARTHPLRLELDNFFFVQALAGPERSRMVGTFLHGMSWLTLVLAPVTLLLYLQAVFLPYHDADITGMQLIAVLADVALLVFIGVFLLRSETSFFRTLWGACRYHPVGLIGTTAFLIAATTVSFTFATNPATFLDSATQPSTQQADEPSVRASLGIGGPTGADRVLFGLLPRNLTVTDLRHVAGMDVTPGKPTLNLRGRDLRFAKLDRNDLRQADMTGAQLVGTSFVGADLRGVWMQCADVDGLASSADRRAARCTDARRSNFSKARLTDGKLSGIDLRGAKLEGARLDGADLSYGHMAGADFAGANLERADITGGAWLQGASFAWAHLEGADLAGAKLQLGNFANASMQGINLSRANLQGAVLRDAVLEGANLQFAKLHGADLTGAKMQGTDMTGAAVWRTLPFASEHSTLSDLALITLRPPEDGDLTEAKAAVDALESLALKKRLADALAPVLQAKLNAGWATSPELQAWQGLAKASETAQADGYRLRLSDFLAKLMCRARFANGAVATGIARRSMAPGFKGDMSALYDKLKGSDCPAAAGVSPSLKQDLAATTDALKE
jgi:uncharacterized protein YjbI with pentapeptide repeats